MRTYAALFIFDDSLNEKALQELMEYVQEKITAFNGIFHNNEVIGKRMLASKVKKHDIGLVARVNFDMLPKDIGAFQDGFKLNINILRVQITQTKRKQADLKYSNKEEDNNG